MVNIQPLPHERLHIYVKPDRPYCISAVGGKLEGQVPHHLRLKIDARKRTHRLRCARMSEPPLGL